MAKINCFHCNAEIELVNTKKGKNKCPNCNKTFKIHNSRTEFENIVMAQTDNNVNTFENTVNLPKAKKINKFENVVISPNDNNINNVIVLPQSTILAKNIKVMILSPFGIISLFLALVFLFGGVDFAHLVTGVGFPIYSVACCLVQLEFTFFFQPYTTKVILKTKNTNII